jgi:hypothetical protein
VAWRGVALRCVGAGDTRCLLCTKREMSEGEVKGFGRAGDLSACGCAELKPEFGLGDGGGTGAQKDGRYR